MFRPGLYFISRTLHRLRSHQMRQRYRPVASSANQRRRLVAPPPFDSASFTSVHRASVLPVCSLLLLLSGKLLTQPVDTPAAARQCVGVSQHFSDCGRSRRREGAEERGGEIPRQTSGLVYQLSPFSQSAAQRACFLSRCAPFSVFFPFHTEALR